MPTSPTSQVQPSPYDAIHYRHEPDRSATPYLGFYYLQKIQKDGKKKSIAVRRRFASPEARDLWAREVADTLARAGRQSAALDPARAARWAIADQMLLPHEDPVAVAAYYRAAHPQTDPTAGPREPRCSALLAAYVEHKRADPLWPWSQYRAIYDAFNSKWGDLRADELARNLPAFEAWLDSLPHAERTRHNYYARLRVAFRWAYRKGRTAANPFDRLQAPSRSAREIAIATPEQVAVLFAANHHLPSTAAKLALSVLAGMRTEAVARLELADIQFAERAIETPAWKTKKRRRQLIQGLPDNLWPWLERAREPSHYAPPCPDRRSRDALAHWQAERKTAWMHEKSAAIARAGLAGRLPSNWARRTFISCHATHFENLPLTAELVSHAETVATIKQHYLGALLKRQAALLFQILPENFQT